MFNQDTDKKVAMLSDNHRWKPWLKHSHKRKSTYDQPVSLPKNGGSKGFILFVRISHEDKSEMFTLRDLHNGLRIYEVKADLELLSGIPTCFMELHSIEKKLFKEDEVLILGENVSFGDTIRVRLNQSWKSIANAAWRGSIYDLKNCLRTSINGNSSLKAFPTRDEATVQTVDQDNVLSKSLFICCRRGDEKMCRLLLKIGSDTMYTSALGNTSLHVASSAGHLSIVQLLVANGSNVRCRNIRGLSPLEAATNRGHFDCARWLWLNQWSVSIAKEVFTPRKTESDTSPSDLNKPSLLHTIGQNRPKTESGRSGIVRSPISHNRDAKEHVSSHYGLRRPQDVAYSSQLKTLDSKIPHRISSANTKSRSYGDFGYNSKTRVSKNGLHSDKTKRILAYYASKREHNISIPRKTADFRAKITNATFPADNNRHRGTRSRGSSRTQSSGESSCSQDPTDQQPQKKRNLPNGMCLGNNSTDSVQRTVSSISGQNCVNVRELLASSRRSTPEAMSNHHETNQITSTLPTPILMPFHSPVSQEKETASRPGSSKLLLEQEKDLRLSTPTRDCAPTIEFDCAYYHDEAIEMDGVIKTYNVPMVSPISETFSKSSGDECNLFPSHVQRSNEAISSFSGTTDGSNGSGFQNSATSSATIAKATGHSREHVTSKESIVPNTRPSKPEIIIIPTEHQVPAQTMHESQDFTTPTARQVTSQVSFDTNKLRSDQPTVSPNKQSFNDRSHTRSLEKMENPVSRNRNVVSSSTTPLHARKSTGSNKNSTNRRPLQKDLDKKENRNPETDESEKERIEKNRKCFESWLMQKRKAAEKRKEEERRDRQTKEVQRTSGITFNEWLQMKREEEEAAANEDDSDGATKTKKREIKHWKSYEVWVQEKEEERRKQLEQQKIIEEQLKIKEEEENEKKKRDYERKREEWLRKKEEMKKHEIEQQKKAELINLENAKAEYEEWLSKPRVKTFDDWMRRKEEISNLERAAKIERDALEQKEREKEEKRQRLAKEKFLLWLRKKELKKLEETEQDLENIKTKNSLNKNWSLLLSHVQKNPEFRKSSVKKELRSFKKNDDANKNATPHTETFYTVSNEDIFKTASSSDEEQLFRISVHITRKKNSDRIPDESSRSLRYAAQSSWLPKEIVSCVFTTLHSKTSGRPKQPMNAYMLFLKEQRESARIKAQIQAEFVRESAQKWREMTSEEKQPFLDRQKDLIEIYRTELAAYNSSLSVEEKKASLDEFRENRKRRQKRIHKKQIVQTDPPKRNISPWIFFVKSRFSAIKIDSLREGNQLMKDATVLWRNMLPQQRQPFVEQAMEDKERYSREMQEYAQRMKAEDKLHLLPRKYQRQVTSPKRKA